MLELLLSVGAAVLISAFCSLSEAAIYSITWSNIEDLRRKGRKSGDILFTLRQDIEKPITAILTVNTVANTAGAAVAGAAAANVFGAEQLVLFTVAFTVIILICSEIVPKTLGVVYAKTLCPLLARPIMTMVWVTMPIIVVMGWLMRFTKRRGEPLSTEDDIRAIVSLTRKAGIIKPYEEMSIRNILSLDLKSVEDIMTPRTVVFSLPSEGTVGEAKTERDFWHHSRIPVYQGGDREEVVGIAYRRDVLQALAEDQDEMTLGQLMKPVEFVLETMTLDRLLIKFLESRTHLFVVLDEYGGVSGVVSLEDVLEEILGKEIVDETDQVADMRELAQQRRRRLVKGSS